MLRASFEETVEVFMNAATYSQYDHLDGVTENVMLGQLAKVGTGLVDLLIDIPALAAAIPYDDSFAKPTDINGMAYDESTPFQMGAAATPGMSALSLYLHISIS